MSTVIASPVKYAFPVGTFVKFSHLGAIRKGTIEKHSQYSDVVRKPFAPLEYALYPSYAIRIGSGLLTAIRESDILEVLERSSLLERRPSEGFMPVFPLSVKGLWERTDGGFYNLKEEFCYPHSLMQLRPHSKTAANAWCYALSMINRRVPANSIEAPNKYRLGTAQSDGYDKRYDATWLETIGIKPDYPFFRSQHVVMEKEGDLIFGTVGDCSLEWVWVKTENGTVHKVRPNVVRASLT